jgi:hypothetical protein
MRATSAETASPLASGAAGTRRPTPRPGDEEAALSRHTPSCTALSERRRADLWKNLAMGMCLASFVLSYLTIRAGRSTELIHVMDPQGNMYAGPAEPLADSRRFFNVTAIYAATAALQRSAAGLDLSELVKLYYLPRAIAKLEQDLKEREPDMRRRNLQWKPILDSISDPVAAGSSRIVEVRGRLVVAGAFANRTFVNEPPFTLVLTLVRNPDLGKSGAYPWVCADLDLKANTSDTARTP